MAKKAKGTTLAKKVDAVETKIASLTNINGLDVSADTLETTNHDTVDGYREFEQGLKDGGEVGIEGLFDNSASQLALKEDFDAGTVNDYVITFPTNPAVKWTFRAIVTGFGTSAPHDGLIGFSASLKVSGKPTLE